MKAKPLPKVERARVKKGAYASNESNGNNGVFNFRLRSGEIIRVVASDGAGWDHVSVSLKDRCPTWDEMSLIKDLFFDESETVVQFHPKKSEYVNFHPFTLHLWRNHAYDYQLPPIFFV